MESNYSHLIQLQNKSKTKDHVTEEEGNQPSWNGRQANCNDKEGEVACDFIGRKECFPEEPEEKSFLDEKVAIDDPQPPKKAKLADDGESGSYESENGLAFSSLVSYVLKGILVGRTCTYFAVLIVSNRINS